MKRRQSEPIHHLLDLVLKEQHLDEKLNELRLINSWPSIVGRPLASQTDQLYIKNRVLHLKVKSAIVRNELMMIRASLVKKLNEAIGKEVINDIVFR